MNNSIKLATVVVALAVGLGAVAVLDSTESDAATIDVSTADQLRQAVNGAADGDTIRLADDIALAASEYSNTTKMVPFATIDDDVTLDLNGHSITWNLENFTPANTDSEYTTLLIFSVSGAAVTINGDGLIDAEAGYCDSYGIDIINDGSLTVNSGTYTGAPTAIQVESGLLTVNDGNFKQAKTIAGDAPDYANYVVNCIDASFKNGTAVIELRGGTYCYDFSNKPEGSATTYVANGYLSKLNESGKYTVEPGTTMQAAIGNTQYATLDEAITAATDGDIVTLLADVELAPPGVDAGGDLIAELVISNDITINLSTHTIDWNDSVNTSLGHDAGIIFSINGCEVIVIASTDGTVDAGAYNTSYAFNVINNGKLTIESGNIYGSASAVQVEAGSLYITGGTFDVSPKFKNEVTDDDRKYIINALDENYGKTATISITGGTFGYDLSDNPEGADTTYCAEGYTMVPSGDDYVCVQLTSSNATVEMNGKYYDSLAFALEDVSTDGTPMTITMLDDFSTINNLGISFPEGAVITLNLNGHNITGAPLVQSPPFQTILNSSDLTITGDGSISANGCNYVVNTLAAGSLTVESGVQILGGGLYSIQLLGKVVVNGATMTADVSIFNVMNASAKLEINSGEFTVVENESGVIRGVITSSTSANAISIKGGTFTSDVSGYCAPGYMCMESNGTYIVQEAPTPAVSITASGDLAVNGNITLTANVSNIQVDADCTYSWSGAGSGSTQSITASAPGTYTVTVTGNSYGEGFTITQSITVTIPTYTVIVTFPDITSIGDISLSRQNGATVSLADIPMEGPFVLNGLTLDGQAVALPYTVGSDVTFVADVGIDAEFTVGSLKNHEGYTTISCSYGQDIPGAVTIYRLLDNDRQMVTYNTTGAFTVTQSGIYSVSLTVTLGEGDDAITGTFASGSIEVTVDPVPLDAPAVSSGSEVSVTVTNDTAVFVSGSAGQDATLSIEYQDVAKVVVSGTTTDVSTITVTVTSITNIPASMGDETMGLDVSVNNLAITTMEIAFHFDAVPGYYISGASAVYMNQDGNVLPALGYRIVGDTVYVTTDHNTPYYVTPMYTEVVAPEPEPDYPDYPYYPGWSDDDVYIPPSYVIEETPEADDNTTTIVACAAAAVVAALMAVFLIMEYRRK